MKVYIKCGLAFLIILLLVGLSSISFAEESKTILFYSHRLSEQPYGDILRKQLDRYMVLHPDIKIETATAPYDETPTKLSSMIMGGISPDMVYCGRYQGIFEPQGLLMDLEPFIKEYGGEEYKNRFPAASAGTVEGPDGDWYAIPAEIQFWTLNINADRAKEAGIVIPKDRQWSWDEFLEVANKLNNPEKGEYAYVNYGYGSSGQALVVGEWMLANGGTYWGIDPRCTEVNLLTKENIEAVKQYVSLGMDGYQPPGYIERGGGDHYRLLGSNSAMAMTHPGGVANAIASSGGKISSFIPLFTPGNGPFKISMFVEAWGIGAGAKHPKLGWDLLNWLNNEDNELERMKLQGTLPALTSALQKAKEQMPDMKFWIDLVEHSQLAGYEYLPGTEEMKQIMNDGLTRIYQGEEVETVLQDVEKKIKEIMKR